MIALVLAAAIVIVRVRRTGKPGSGDTPDTRLGQRILVAVAHPASAEGLGGLAGVLARPDRGRVEALTVFDGDAPAGESALAEETVGRCSTAVLDAGAESTSRMRVDASVGEGVLHRTVELDASLVVLGWPGPSQSETPSGVGLAVSESPAPLLLARLQGYRWERVRLCTPRQAPSEGLGASLRLASEVSERIADAHDLLVVHESLVEHAAPEIASELRVLPVPPDGDAVREAIEDTNPLGDLVLAVCHGPRAREQRALLASAERLYEAAISSPPS